MKVLNIALVSVVCAIRTSKEPNQWWNSCKDFGFTHDEAAFCTPALEMWRNIFTEGLRCIASNSCWRPPNDEWRRLIEDTNRWKRRIPQDKENNSGDDGAFAGANRINGLDSTKVDKRINYFNSSNRVTHSKSAGRNSVLKEVVDDAKAYHSIPLALSFSTYSLTKSNSRSKPGLLRGGGHEGNPETKPDSGNDDAIGKADHNKIDQTTDLPNAGAHSSPASPPNQEVHGGRVIPPKATFAGSTLKDVEDTVNKGSVLAPPLTLSRSGEQTGMGILLGLLALGFLGVCIVGACTPSTPPPSVAAPIPRSVPVVQAYPASALHPSRSATTSAEVAKLGRVAHL
jgi:hypothetical protein